MPRDRNYPSGTEKALFLLSRGYCYRPECKRRVLLKSINGEPHVNVQIAHIEGLEEDSARHNPKLDDKQVNSFRNLILLCKQDHDEIDSKLTRDLYPVDLLHEWKTKREGDLMGELEDLDWLTQERLEGLMKNALATTEQQITEAIDVIASTSKEVAQVIRALIEESFNRPYFDRETVASLEVSARSLSHLPDTSILLSRSSRELINLPDYVSLLHYSSEAFGRIVDHVGPLHEAATKLDRFSGNVEILHLAASMIQQSGIANAVDSVHGLDQTASSLREAASSIAGVSGNARQLKEATQDLSYALSEARANSRVRSRSFAWGIVAGVIGSIAILILTAILTH